MSDESKNIQRESEVGGHGLKVGHEFGAVPNDDQDGGVEGHGLKVGHEFGAKPDNQDQTAEDEVEGHQGIWRGPGKPGGGGVG